MTAKEIYMNLCNFRDQKGGMSPFELEKEGIKCVDVDHLNMTDDVISHTIFIGDDGNLVEEKITSYDHSRTFEIRPDSNHFEIKLLGTEDSHYFVIMDDI